MSHIVCPLCGLNRPIKNFDFTDYPLDLKLRTWHGLGHARGFEYEDTSVLGDETYSPLIANRTLDITRMFVDVRTLSIKDIFSKLGYPNLINQFKNTVNSNRMLTEINQDFSSKASFYRIEINRLNDELSEVKEKKVKENETIETIFSISYIEGLNCKVIFEDSMIKLFIYLIEENAEVELYEMFLKMGKEEWKDLAKRLIPGDVHVKTYLHKLSEINRLKKNMFDMLIEYDLRRRRGFTGVF